MPDGGRSETTRNDLFKEYVRLVRGLEPRVFVMENVAGMASGRMKGRFIEIMKTLKALDYRVRCRLMNSKYYGVPQSREAPDLHRRPEGPGPGPGLPRAAQEAIVTVRKAFEGLPPQVEDRPMPDWLRQAAKHIKAGMNFKHIADCLPSRPRGPRPGVSRPAGSSGTGLPRR